MTTCRFSHFDCYTKFLEVTPLSPYVPQSPKLFQHCFRDEKRCRSGNNCYPHDAFFAMTNAYGHPNLILRRCLPPDSPKALNTIDPKIFASSLFQKVSVDVPNLFTHHCSGTCCVSDAVAGSVFGRFQKHGLLRPGLYTCGRARLLSASLLKFISCRRRMSVPPLVIIRVADHVVRGHLRLQVLVLIGSDEVGGGRASC